MWQEERGERKQEKWDIYYNPGRRKAFA